MDQAWHGPRILLGDNGFFTSSTNFPTAKHLSCSSAARPCRRKKQATKKRVLSQITDQLFVLVSSTEGGVSKEAQVNAEQQKLEKKVGSQLGRLRQEAAKGNKDDAELATLLMRFDRADQETASNVSISSPKFTSQVSTTSANPPGRSPTSRGKTRSRYRRQSRALQMLSPPAIDSLPKFSSSTRTATEPARGTTSDRPRRPNRHRAKDATLSPQTAAVFSAWSGTSEKVPYHLSLDLKHRSMEEKMWLKFLLERPKMWFGLGVDKQAQAQMETFARSIAPFCQMRCSLPTLEYLYNNLLPSWARQELAGKESTFAILEALQDVDDVEALKAWIAAKHARQKQPLDSPAEQIARDLAGLSQLYPVTEANYRTHLAALAPLLTTLGGRGSGSASLSHDPGFDGSTQVESLFSTIGAFVETENVDVNAPENTLFNMKRFTYSETIPDPTTTALEGDEAQIFTSLRPSKESAQRAHVVANRPTTNNLRFRVKIYLILISGMVDIERWHIHHPSNLFYFKSDLHADWDSHELLITPEIDWLDLAVKRVRQLNEERKRLADKKETLFPLPLFGNLPQLEVELGRPCRFALYCLKPDPRYPTSFNKFLPPLPGSDFVRMVPYSAQHSDGLFRNSSGEIIEPEAFTRPSQPWHHRPNPYLFALNAAAKLLVHKGNTSSATLKPVLLCLELVSQLFRFAPTDAPAEPALPADMALSDERARMWAQDMQKVRTPAKTKDAGRSKSSGSRGRSKDRSVAAVVEVEQKQPSSGAESRRLVYDG
ncbi:RHTO0S01e15324g1_1 [Rhodotorula toruloides]|uniref:RHTO0S01e15324g1_1 n=2 Tax=Rhodotorula toruloides TaxID=5286 RepID=A0A061AF34_RHOTO|nr:RHTO0S01e15324g1_1 [Rhodotorula toruloides]